MKIGNYIIFEKRSNEAVNSYRHYDGLGFTRLSSFNCNQALRLSAVYAATNQISNSVALLPINIYRYDKDRKVAVDHPLQKVFNLRPDIRYNHYNFVKMMVESVILRGDAFALIERDDRLNVTGFRYIDSTWVTPTNENGRFKYIVEGYKQAFDDSEIIHLYQHLDDVGRGISVIRWANDTLKGAADIQVHMDNFFRSGANLSGVLEVNQPSTPTQRQELYDSWNASFTGQPDKVQVAVMPQGVSYKPISVSAKDAELLEIKNATVIDIARYFNISPIKLFDYQHNSYSTLEQTQIDYIQDTLMPYLQMLKEELEFKVLKPSERGKLVVEFDISRLLEADKKTQAEYYRSMVNNTIMTINECRRKLALEPVEDGDVLLGQLNLTTLENIVAGVNTNLLDNQYKPSEEKQEEQVQKVLEEGK